MRQLKPALAFALLSGAAAAAQTVVTSSTMDAGGLGSNFAALVSVGTITAGGTLNIKIQGGDLADGSDKADIEGATLALTDTAANKLALLEIHRPPKRYLTVVVTRAAQNSALVSIHGIVSGAYDEPITQTQLIDSIALVSPEMA